MPGETTLGGKGLAWTLLIGLLGVVPYSNTIDAGFTAADHAMLILNPQVPPTASLLAPFLGPSDPTGRYRPVTMLTYLANHRLGGGPAAFHATNVALFACTSAIAFLLARRLSRSTGIAVAAALVWAVHPVHADGVASVSGRAELLGALWLLASLLSLARWLARGALGGAGWYGSSLVTFALALGSKEGALVGALLVPLVVWRLDGAPRGRRLLAVSAPYWALVAAFLLVRVLVVGSAPPSPAPELGAGSRISTAVLVLWQAVGLLAVPIGLPVGSLGDAMPVTSPTDPRLVVAALGLTGVAMIAWACRRYAPLVTFGIVFALASFAAAVYVAAPPDGFAPGQLLFVASFGWCLVAGWTLATWIGRPADRGRVAATVVLLGLLALGTWTRNVDWRDDDALLAITAQAEVPTEPASDLAGHPGRRAPSGWGPGTSSRSRAYNQLSSTVPSL